MASFGETIPVNGLNLPVYASVPNRAAGFHDATLAAFAATLTLAQARAEGLA